MNKNMITEDDFSKPVLGDGLNIARGLSVSCRFSKAESIMAYIPE
jgi:hypothetical protein